MYKVHDWYNNVRYHFSGWWELIDWLNDLGRINTVAHNHNDVISYYDFKFKRLLDENVDYASILAEEAKQLLLGNEVEYTENTRHIYVREFIVYDEYDRIINLSDLKKSLLVYKPKPYKWVPWVLKRYKNVYWEYRKDPVPGVGNGNYPKRNNGHFNKSYKAKLMEYYSLFPNSGRMREYDSFWWDDGKYFNKNYRCWKNKKIRKQWMKNKASQ